MTSSYRVPRFATLRLRNVAKLLEKFLQVAWPHDEIGLTSGYFAFNGTEKKRARDNEDRGNFGFHLCCSLIEHQFAVSIVHLQLL